MAKIVYGVSGEGSGHSSRAREMAAHIERLGHVIKMVSYDRGYRNLKDDFDVFENEGLHIASLDNKVSKVKTFTDNLKKISKGHKRLMALRKHIFKTFKPDCVITDFEPMTAYLTNHYDLPLITVDNQHRFRYMMYECPAYLKNDQLLTENIIRAMVPRPDVSLVTTFYYGNVKNDRTFLFPPILRREVLDLKPASGKSILVYLTSGFESFLDLLKTFTRERFLVYGYDREDKDGNLQYKAFSKDGFLLDLADTKAVMATAGFTLMTESLHLQKPYLALPMNGQFEQELNAIFLEQLQYGMNVREISMAAIGHFLYSIPDFKKRLRRYQAKDNTEIKKKIEELLANDCAVARAFHKKRAG